MFYQDTGIIGITFVDFLVVLFIAVYDLFFFPSSVVLPGLVPEENSKSHVINRNRNK